jgi:hypothetical protein
MCALLGPLIPDIIQALGTALAIHAGTSSESYCAPTLTVHSVPVCIAVQVSLRLLVPVLDLGLLRFLLGSLEPLLGLEVLGAILFARLRAREACLGKVQLGLHWRNHEENCYTQMRRWAGSLLQS